MRQDVVVVPSELIENKIYIIRRHKVMLDRDLAELYAVPVKVLNQAVKRNIQRFPEDFMFTLNEQEAEALRSQFVTLEKGRGKHSKYKSHVFTEHGILMLSSVLNSEKAIAVNIAIMRVFVKLRKIMIANKDLALRLEQLEHTVEKQGEQIHSIFDVVKQLMAIEEKPKRNIGFHGE
ncbi:MAG: ORF6N domain-containing protein [Candidatus Omnitrophica bacterium]|nr:ORF6N domain-containing protein [Candidatus Omnitrophota bacterium]